MDSSFEVIRSVERDAQQSIADSRREVFEASRHTVTYSVDLTTKGSAREGSVTQIFVMSQMPSGPHRRRHLTGLVITLELHLSVPISA